MARRWFGNIPGRARYLNDSADMPQSTTLETIMKKLRIEKETLRTLQSGTLVQVAGGCGSAAPPKSCCSHIECTLTCPARLELTARINPVPLELPALDTLQQF